MQLDPELASLYVRALLAIARADREIDSAEGSRLDAVIQRRAPGTSLADVMFMPALRTDELERALGTDTGGGPFRKSNVDPREVGLMFVKDALEVCARNDGLSSAEESALLRYATVFGMPVHESARRTLAGRTGAHMRALLGR